MSYYINRIANDYRLDGCIRVTTTRGNVGTYEGKNHLDIRGYTKTFGEIKIDIPIAITDNREKWKDKIAKLQQEAFWSVIRVK